MEQHGSFALPGTVCRIAFPSTFGMFGCTPVWSVLPGLNSCDDQGNVPLHYAVEKNKLESCRALLDLGADPNILNTAFMAPLHLAVSLQYNDLVEVRMPGEKRNISRCLIYQIKSVYLHSKWLFSPGVPVVSVKAGVYLVGQKT